MNTFFFLSCFYLRAFFYVLYGGRLPSWSDFNLSTQSCVATFTFALNSSMSGKGMALVVSSFCLLCLSYAFG